MSSDELTTGSRVLVANPGNDFHAEEEVGVVVCTNCEYEDADSASTKYDGIMVKLQISNTRGIFPSSQVTLVPVLGTSPVASHRRSRRALVSPSPVADQTEEAKETETTSKRAIHKEPKEAVARKRAKKSDTSSINKKKQDDSSKKGFRVQVSPSSGAKCKDCGESIQKNFLRMQPTTQKKGWYHVACSKKSFESLPSAEAMEGFNELSESEQKLLQSQLGEAVAGKVTPLENFFAEEDDDDDDGDDPPLASLKAKKQKATSKKAAPKKKKGKAAAKRPAESEEEADDDMLLASDTDSDDLKDRPFRVEYATSGRAACRGCDEKIAKGILRIAERPLFRGKPGFTVYRHLKCTVFSETIQCMQDVGGWRRLRKSDRADLAARVEESKLLVEKENQELQPDELVQVTFQGEILAPPTGLSANLLPFQVEGSSWMTHREMHVPSIRGGILADEMGMGKTLQTITTILHNRPKLQHSKPGAKHPPSSSDVDLRKREENLWKDSLAAWKHEMEKVNVPKKLLTEKVGKNRAPMGARGGTLVVCPVIALYQWREEIKKFTEENALTVCCYHGPNRAKEFPRDILCKYDVVLTTYQVIEADFRKMVSPNKVKCPNCGGAFKIDKLRIHLKYFCGESAQRTEAQARQRRTADRRGRSNQGGGKNGSKKGKGKQTKKTMAKAKASSKVATRPPKKTLRAKKRKGYDSDSDLSIDADLDLDSPRPRRSAAASASKKMSASARTWGGDQPSSGSDSASYSSNDPSSEDDESTDPPQTRLPSQKDVFESSSDSESEDEQVVARARKKQEEALARARKNKSQGGKKKTFSKPKGKMQKKPTPHYSSSSEDESSDDEDADRDPLEGIDLDKLMQEAMDGSRASVVHTICWWRVVLDEAHMIKSRASQTAAAAFALTSIHRWCLSGTPLQNRVGELYSLIRFLRIDPMAHYFCRKDGCDCKSVHYRMLHGKCLDCGHGTIQHYSYFNKHVLNPIQRAGYQGDGRRAMMKLKNEVLDKSLIRRTKQTRAEDMNLPPRVVNIRTVRLHPIEEDFYNALYTQTKSSFDDYVTEGTLLNNYAHIFDLLTKMRQAVDHPYLIVFSKKNAGKFRAPGAPAVANGSVDCELCHEPPTDRVVSSCCGSAFCRSCVIDYMSPALENVRQGDARCPSCQEPFSVDLNQATQVVEDDGTLTVSAGTGSVTDGMPSLKDMTHVSSGSILRRINLAEFATSTKVEALVQELVQMRQQRPGSKALVFSQFVNMLDLVRWRLHSDPCLHDLGLGVRIVHGGMNVQARDDSLKAFREDSSVRVLLMSLKAGGVALNLTVANEAYLLDPWWNPAAEMQAIDRTHRLGQYRPIRAVRFIAEGTVEERVLQLQEKKRLVFDGTVGRDAASLKMLTVDDMKALFA